MSIIMVAAVDVAIAIAVVIISGDASDNSVEDITIVKLHLELSGWSLSHV